MVNRYPRKKRRIEVRIGEDFIPTYLKFQQICIDSESSESEFIRELIKIKVNEVEEQMNRPIVIRLAEPLDKYDTKEAPKARSSHEAKPMKGVK